MTQGTCPANIPLSISISKDNATCNSNKNCDGSISIYAFNGVPPYSYSINNGLTYQSSGIFNGLCANNYTVIVQDSNGDIVNGGVVPVGADNNPVNYSISTQLINNVSYSQGDQVASWKVNITPPLPTGVTMTFQLKVNATQKNNGPGSGTTINNTIVRKNGVTITAPAITTATQTSLRPNCSPFSTLTTSTTQVYNITMGHGDVVTGTSQSLIAVTSGVTGSNGCITMVEQTILVSTYSAAISGKASCGQAVNNPAGQGVVNHQLSSAVSTNPLSLRTLTGTTTCSGGILGVYGTTSLQTLYTNATPGFVDGATVYLNANRTIVAPNGLVFRSPNNNTNSSVYIVVNNGVISFEGTYGGPC
jgi:hypothetical protein